MSGAPSQRTEGFKKQNDTHLWKIRKFLDVSAQSTKADAMRVRFRIIGLCSLVCGLGAWYIQFNNTIRYTGNQASVHDTTAYFRYRLLYGRARSRFAGVVANWTIPMSWREPIYNTYAKAFNAKLHEARFPAYSYPNLQEFFSRTLADGVRPIPAKVTEMDQQKSGSTVLTSPVDAELVTVGVLEGDRAIQIKDATYSMYSFLGSNPSARLEEKKNTKIVYCTLYLAPGDYHHFHSPCNFTVKTRKHFPGECLPVKKSLASWFNDLFSVNERVVLDGEWTHGKMHYAAVAAYNVGNIEIHHDKVLTTNSSRTIPFPMGGEKFVFMPTDPWEFQRGSDIGTFKLGSTIVMCFEAPLDWEWNVELGSKVQLNTVLGGTRKELEELKKQ